MAMKLRISEILDHLAWLRKQLAVDVNQGNAYAGALLTYNAAALLQWHFVFPGRDMSWIDDRTERAQAAKVIDDFVWVVRDLFQQAKKHHATAIPTSKNSVGVIADLRKQIAKVLRALPKLLQLSKPTPSRAPECERSINPTEMLKQWLLSRPPIDSQTSAVLKKTAVTDSRSTVRSALAGALFVGEESGSGRRRSKYMAGSSEVVAVLFGTALGDYSKSFSGKSAKRTAAFCEDIAAHLAESTPQ